jgi:hypothetical protein
MDCPRIQKRRREKVFHTIFRLYGWVASCTLQFVGFWFYHALVRPDCMPVQYLSGCMPGYLQSNYTIYLNLFLFMFHDFIIVLINFNYWTQ